MSLFNQPERNFAEVFSRLVECNPFLEEWVKLEREALGQEFIESPSVYSRQSEWGPMQLHPNVRALGERVEQVAQRARQRLTEGERATAQELNQYQDLVLYHLYVSLGEKFDGLVQAPLATHPRSAMRPIWERFDKEWQRFFRVAGLTFPTESRRELRPEHIFAWFFQLRRAFYHIYANIVGRSAPAGRLRGAVWQSIFTHDMRRWHRALHARMGEFPTLITGPSGSGKELVARAVGLSRYIPFDPQTQQFAVNFAGSFHPLNLSALAPTLIESELFGHRKGSFTGALEDREGWLERCEQQSDGYGTVFLDEIGDLDTGIQVKLLRVLQTGQFNRLGESEERKFTGKIVSATNRALAAEMQAGRFREDFYYRLCADRITTPSLREQLAAAPDDLQNLLRFIARSIIGEEEAEALAREVEVWIDQNLGRAYRWPGNFRELEQCVRNVMIRQAYEPIQRGVSSCGDAQIRELAEGVTAGAFSLDELQRRYITLVYSQSRSFQDAARRLDCNWRTIRGKVDQELLRNLASKVQD